MSEDGEFVRKANDKLLGRHSPSITLEIKGAEEDEGGVRLNAFIEQLENLKDALRQTERVLYGGEGSVFYRITAINKNSPAMITIEAVPASDRHNNSVPIVAQFFAYLDHLSEHEQVKRRPELDLSALEAFRQLAPTRKRHISELRVFDKTNSYTLDETFHDRVGEVIGPDEVTVGEVVGTLEVLNLHNKMRFEVFPPMGPKVICNFHEALKRDVIGSIDRYVRVAGRVRYKRCSTYPHAIDAASIECFPLDEELPTLFDLRGIAPDMTNGETPETFIRKIRDAIW